MNSLTRALGVACALGAATPAVADDPTFTGVSAYLAENVKAKVGLELGPAVVNPFVAEAERVKGKISIATGDEVFDRVFVEAEGVRVETYAGDEFFQLSGAVGFRVLEVLTASVECEYRNDDKDPCYDRINAEAGLVLPLGDATVHTEFRRAWKRGEAEDRLTTGATFGQIDKIGTLLLETKHELTGPYELNILAEVNVLSPEFLKGAKLVVQNGLLDVTQRGTKNFFAGFKATVSF